MQILAKNYISIIIPTLNESGNIKTLVKRIDNSLTRENIAYQLIFIDDHSTDDTLKEIEALISYYPIEYYLKKGKAGKAFSILEGIKYAKYHYCGFIDADLQYPPEAIPEMIKKLNYKYDVVIANRIYESVSILRQFISKVFNVLFAILLHNLKVDTQSGLKVFKTKIGKEVKIDPTPWTFDLEFLLQARNFGYVIGQVDINFGKRQSGQTKINYLKAIWEIGWNAFKLKFKIIPPALISPKSIHNMKGAGIAHKRQRFITHTTLKKDYSALNTFSIRQGIFLIFLGGILFASFFVNPLLSAVIFLGTLNFLYFFDSLFNLFLVFRSIKEQVEIKSSKKELESINEDRLPVYTILCPLYKEAKILSEFLKGISDLEWPKNKLDVLLLLEEDDKETITAAKNLELPSYVSIIVVPDSMPKTKPKACNYGLAFARGEYTVIYDAEDKPDPWQLKKVYLGFQKLPSSVRCLQAKLNYYNARQNLLTRMFTAEYSLWFDIILPGLQSITTSIPLGGTSNHFRTFDLLELEGWDPFNVTEDCDLGVRIFKRGYKTAIIDSVTLEEANSRVGNWLRQRSRWIKGYMQTYLVHMRHPWDFIKNNGIHSFIFQLTVGGKVAFMVINPFLWITTISYFTLNTLVGPFIEALFPPVIFYISVFSLIFGNFFYIYYYMVGCARRGHWDLIKYVFFIPFYWAMVSMAAGIAFYQLLVKPHYWEKTLHGLHLVESPRARLNLKWIIDPANVGLRTIKQTFALNAKIFSFFRKIIFAESHKIKSSLERTIKQKYTINNVIEQNPVFEKIKKLSLSGEMFFIAGLMGSNVINFIYHAYLGRVLSFENFALVALINTIWYLAMIFLNSLGTTVNSSASRLLGAENKRKSELFFKAILLKSLKFSLFFSVIWILLLPVLSGFFNIESTLVLLFITPIFSFGVLVVVCRGFLQGIFRFSHVSAIFLTEALSKLAIVYIFVKYGFENLAYLSIPASIILSAIIGAFFVNKKVSLKLKPIKMAFPRKFFTASLMANVSSMVFLSVDMILVKHYLSAVEAGKYALLALVGKMIFFLASIPGMFFMSYVSRSESQGADSGKIYRNIYLMTLFLVAPGVLFFGVLGKYTVPILLGSKAQEIIDFLLPYSIAIGVFTMANMITMYHLAKKHYTFSHASLFGSIVLTIGISQFHSSINEVVAMIWSASIGIWLTLEFLHLLKENEVFITHAVKDLLGVFVGRSPVKHSLKASQKKVLIFNWRDIKHKYAGGAEIYLHEITKRWVKQGAQVTIFCGNDGKSPRQEIIDGITIIRRGGFYLVYVWAFFYYMFRFRKKYDIIIDCENGIPFFTPLYVREPVYCLMHHVHQEVFRKSLNKLMASFAMFLEKDLMPLVYKKKSFITVSESSKKEIKKLGMGLSGINIINPGVDLDRLYPGQKNSEPLVLYLGRLKAYKSINNLLDAFKQVLAKTPKARLVIAGSGEELGRLKAYAEKISIASKVFFAGHISEFEKLLYLQLAWVSVNPSYMEGWGITTIEANACATPVIASDVPGLRDSVRNPSTGYLVEYGNINKMSEKILKVIGDEDLRNTMGRLALEWSEKFDWNKNSREFLDLIDFPYIEKEKFNKFLLFKIWQKNWARTIK